MQINDTLIDDTFAEAFPMKATRLVITAHTPRWARAAADSLGATARRLGDPGKFLFGPPAGSLGPGEGAK